MSNFDIIPLVPQPNMKVNLYKHQLANIHRMEQLEEEKMVYYSNVLIKETKLGLLCDKTGYGKTLSIIGLIVRDKMNWDISTPYVMENSNTDSSGLITTRKSRRYTKLPTNLIVVSPSVVSQWVNEIKYTSLKYALITSKKKVENICPSDYDIVITVPSIFNFLIKINSKNAWKRFIYDEPGHMRISGMKKVIAGFYWLVTATPEEIYTQHKNCRDNFMKKLIQDDILSFSSQFEGMIIKNEDEFVKESFSMPETFETYYDCYQPVLKTLSGCVNSTITNLIESGNIEGAINYLGGKTNNLLELVKENKLDKLDKLKTKKYIYEVVDSNPKKLENVIKDIETINNDLNEIQKRTTEMLNDNCSICMNILNKPVLETHCHNIFCGECLLKWLNKSSKCPLCRADINKSDLVYLSTDKDCKKLINTTTDKKITQIEMVIKIINNNKNGKFIIYSSNDVSFEPLYRVLEENFISFTTIKGNYKERENSVSEYKNGLKQIIFLNTNHNGSGLNLQETTDIIIYHQITNDMKTQVIGRANRIGRKIPLNVHYLKVNM